jgi:HlyD family secretion protein
MNVFAEASWRSLKWVVKRPRRAGLLGLGLVSAAGVLIFALGSPDDATTATVGRGNLAARLTVSGVLRPVQSITYRSPLIGRETEITFLVAEGTRVNQGDLLVRLDTLAVERELERGNQELRQAEVDLQVAEIERQEGEAAIDSLSEGAAALTRQETQTRLALAERKAARLREEQQTLAPLMEKGFISREELRRRADELERAEEDLALARRADASGERTYPRDRRKAQLQLAQKEAQLENVRARLQEIQLRVRRLREAIENASIYARNAGLVVYEQSVAANPRRKIRIGDRVTEIQGLVTIPELNRMLVEGSVSEADVRRVQPGQPARVVLEAFGDRRFTGRVTRVGTLARASDDRSFEGKRFDLILELDSSDVDLRPEMTARIDILVGQRSGVLLVPVNAIFERQGLPVVHVVRAFHIDTRQVQLGETGDTQVEVVAGLAEGDRVALVDTASSAGSPVPSNGTIQASPMGGTTVAAPR